MNFRPWLVACLVLGVVLPVPAQAEDTFGLGDGHSGTLVVDGGATATVNRYAALSAGAASGTLSVNVGTTAGFSAGDLVMVIQVSGYAPIPDSGTPGPFDLSGSPVGTYELIRIASVGATSLVFTTPLVRGYSTPGSQVLKIPEYTTVAVDSTSSVAAAAWNGSTGGILAFLCQGTVLVDGKLSADQMGFRGGALVPNSACTVSGCSALDEGGSDGGEKGEGIVPSRYGIAFTGRGQVTNGGGGGVCEDSGGGGGGNGGAGGMGGYSLDSTNNVGGMGGTAVSYSLLDHLTFGGGGGAPHECGSNMGTAGGAGGGAVFFRAGRLQGAGVVSAHGQTPPDERPTAAGSDDATGGGGAGGSIAIRLTGTGDMGSISVAGGNGGSTYNLGTGHPTNYVGPGGGGGGGRVLLQRANASSFLLFNVLNGVGGTLYLSNDNGTSFVAHPYGSTPTSYSDPNYLGLFEIAPAGGYVPTLPPDAGVPSDGGVFTPDGGYPDAGNTADGGHDEADAGNTVIGDKGAGATFAPDGGILHLVSDLGCAFSRRSGGHGPDLVVLLLVAAVLLARRRGRGL